MRGDDIDLEAMLGLDPTDAPPLDTSGKAVLERSRSYPVNGLAIQASRRARKNTPEMLRRALAYAAELPVGTEAARRMGINYTTLRYWLQKSKEGAPGDGFDIVMGDEDENGTPDNTVRFHEAWDDAIMVGVDAVEAATIRRATGYDEVLTYQGRVQYKYDPVKVAESIELGIPEYVPQNFLLDRYGAPIPETVFKMDPDLAMFILKSRKPQVYGAKASLDVNVKGGVLVVGMKVAAPADLNLLEEEYRRVGTPLVTFDEDEGSNE